LGNSGGFGPGDAYSNIVEVVGSATDTSQQIKAKQEADAKASNTALIPPGNVSCSLTSSGVSFGVSLTFTSGNVVIGNLTYDWDYAILIEGKDPTLVSNYLPRQFFRTTSANSLNLSYEELLALASKNPGSTVLVFASPKNSLPDVSVKNTSGKGCYVELKAVLKNKQDAEKAAADAKAAAELKAKQEAELKAAAELKAKEEADLRAAAELKARQDAELKAAAELKAKQEAAAKAALVKKVTVTCVKGKTVKKVTAVKPKCPAGYKKK
jgi:hypothetical protein